MKRSHWLRNVWLCLALVLLPGMVSAAWEIVSDEQWNETAVRKVLNTFLFGAFASDAQIKTWADMAPTDAIQQILTFEHYNHYLSPVQDSTLFYGGSLEALQGFWSETSLANPVPPDRRRYYATLSTNADGSNNGYVETGNLQRTWVQAINTRGINPFLHRMGMYLTNYHMAISVDKSTPALMRSFYDSTILSLQQGKTLIDVLAEGAYSAAVALSYGHQYNRFVNSNGRFYGNDDFAREFHQLFFKIQGDTEVDVNYHENITIENTAHALTGMRVDQTPNAYGATNANNWWVAPIIFTNHSDGRGNTLNNYDNHHWNCLEVLHQQVCGASAQEKIAALAQIAGYHPESLANLPVAIVDFFADDNLTPEKKAALAEEWTATEPKDILTFLRNYAVSRLYHSRDTVKYRNAFDRNLVVLNMNTLSNTETFARFDLPISQLQKEGAEVFDPAHDVFGGQTGLQAANNPNIFRDAYQRNVLQATYLARTSANYQDANGVTKTWTKDWVAAMPWPADEVLEAKDVAEWLWKRFVGDGGKYLDKPAKAQLHAILATGYDFGYAVSLLDPSYSPDQVFTTSDIAREPLKYYNYQFENTVIALNSTDPVARAEANRRVGLAVNFITATPYVFAQEGR